MLTVTVRFYSELNDLLKDAQRGHPQIKKLLTTTTVRDIIQSYGIPTTEVDLVLVNGQSVGFEYLVQDNDQLGVYPVFESFDIASVSRLRPSTLRSLCFIADVHLGKLVRKMRLLGLDVLYDPRHSTADLLHFMNEEKRIILTRNKAILMRKSVERGYLVRARQPERQIIEVLKRFELARGLKPLSRCVKCNGLLSEVSKAQVVDKLKHLTKKYYRQFYRCTDCNTIYWDGAHVKNIRHWITGISRELVAGTILRVGLL